MKGIDSVGFRVAAAGVAIALAFAALLHLFAARYQPDAAPSPSDTPPSSRIILPQEASVLPETPAGNLVAAHCTACHSVDMITRQPPLNAEKWAATVKKMREAYHAPIVPSDDAALITALISLQGTGK